jgi:hypothetical protein
MILEEAMIIWNTNFYQFSSFIYHKKLGHMLVHAVDKHEKKFL